MWSSIENLKENLNKIANGVHDDDDEEEDGDLSIYGGGDVDSPYTDRRRSHSLAHSKSSSDSPMSNGVDSNGVGSPYVSEIDRYKAEIKKLKESEAEIRTLSVSYAALLREREEHITKLNQENGSLKQNLEATNAAMNSSRDDASKLSTKSLNGSRGGGEKSPKRQSKVVNLTKNRSVGNQWQNGVKLDTHSNGFGHGVQTDAASKISNSFEKELADTLEEKNRLLAAVQSDHELQIEKLRMELEKEREALTNARLKLQDEQRIGCSLKEELGAMKSDHNKVNELRKELDGKVSEIKQLQMELSKRANEGANDMKNASGVIARLEKENVELKAEKEKLESALEESSRAGKKSPISTDESVHVSTSFPGKDELEQSLQKTEKELKEARRGRDKALQELSRLKQHLLDKELEESEKMDEDSKIIEELRQHIDYQKTTISNLERALQQARLSQEEVKMMNDHEMQKSKETIEDLKKKLANFMSIIDAKNMELLNLQTALGQYYAEIEAKERLQGDLSLAREQCSKLEQLLQDSKQQVEASNKEKEEILVKHGQTDKMVAEWKNLVVKLEEDNAKLRRAVEQSMTRLNRMSVDSDFLVDRRIVIKLLVTYFQRNHSKEVLDLMVRMLGFTDEDKQRIGAAQQGGKQGAVRGVLGLPGRLVGGMFGGGSAGVSTNMASDNQSFADLWVDFLLKESEEREKRESTEASGGTNGVDGGIKPAVPVATLPLPDRRTGGRPPTAPTLDTSRSLYSYQNTRQYDTGSAEFSTVPLTPSER